MGDSSRSARGLGVRDDSRLLRPSSPRGGGRRSATFPGPANGCTLTSWGRNRTTRPRVAGWPCCRRRRTRLGPRSSRSTRSSATRAACSQADCHSTIPRMRTGGNDGATRAMVALAELSPLAAFKVARLDSRARRRHGLLVAIRSANDCVSQRQRVELVINAKHRPIRPRKSSRDPTTTPQQPTETRDMTGARRAKSGETRNSTNVAGPGPPRIRVALEDSQPPAANMPKATSPMAMPEPWRVR